MVQLCELSIFDRGLLVKGINTIMKSGYNVDQKSINEFWETLSIGAEVRNRT